MKCLNCGEMAENKFCSHCGQKTSTHRFSLKHFFSHDVMHGAFHLDHGFPETIKELTVNPGSGILNYIQGKRTKYFNYITLLLILIGVSHFIEQYTLIDMGEILGNTVPNKPDEEVSKEVTKLNSDVFNFMRDHPKITIISLIPFYALISRWVFKKANQNYAEHLVLTFYKTSGIVLIGYISVITRLFTADIQTNKIVFWIISVLGTLYTIIYCYRYFKPFDFTKRRLLWKSIRYTALEFLFQLIVGVVIAAIYLVINKVLV